MRKAILLLFLFIAAGVKAQTDTSATTTPAPKDKPQFKLGVYYNSNLNYYGRTDSLRSSGFFPLAEFWINKHFYVNAAPVFVNNAVQSFEYAGTVTTAGYMFNDLKRWAGHIYFVKPIYKDNSDLVQSALKAQAAMTFTLQNKILNLTAGADAKFSDKTDIGGTFGLDHIIRYAWGKNVFVIDPSAYLYAGTQQFAKTYYRKNSLLIFPVGDEQVTEKVNRFNVLSYELSMPVIYARGKFQAMFLPAYVIPRNLLTVEGQPSLSERGKDMFYATVGAKVIF